MNKTMTKMTMVVAMGLVVIALAIMSEFSVHYNYGGAKEAITEKNFINPTPSLSSNLTIQTLDTKKLKIALLTDALFSDAGWGAFGYNAAQELSNKYGYEIDFKDNVSIPDIENTLRQYSKSGYDLIIAQGFKWGAPAVEVGKDYPNIKFVVFTGLGNSNNVASIFPMQQQATYLLGALAAMMTKTGIIGFVGGEKYPNVVDIYEGYKQGAHDINPHIKVLAIYLNDWDNATKGKKAAISQINSGADLILHVADSSGHGVIQAAKEKGIYAFGAVSDQNKLAPNTVLTSFVLDVDKAFDKAVKMVKTGNFTGIIFKPGLELDKGAKGDGIVYLAPFHNLKNSVPDAVKLKIEQLKRQILNGTIVVPEGIQQHIGINSTAGKTIPK
jgi:basic membrane protein A